MTSRRYAFTSWVRPQCDTDTFKYICYGEELTPSTNKFHFQGYLELNAPARISAVKKYLKDNSVHLEKAKGTKEQNIQYCRKDGKFFEYENGLEKSITSSPVTICHRCNTLSGAYDSIISVKCPLHRKISSKEFKAMKKFMFDTFGGDV